MAENINWVKPDNPLDQVIRGKAYNPDEAVALQELIIKSIKRRLKEIPNLADNEYKKIFSAIPGSDKWTKKDLKKYLKTHDYDIYRIIKDLPNEQKALRRGLAEMLTTDANFFDQKGVLELFKQDLSKLKGPELAATLKSWDRNFSWYKGSTGKVVHHTTLSALTDVLKEVDRDWRIKFNTLAANDGFKIGDAGGVELAPGAHKAFSTDKLGNINIKGELATKLSKFLPNLPFDKNKQALTYKPGTIPQLDQFIGKLDSISSHGKWAGGTGGFTLSRELAQLSPENAYNVARNLLGGEVAIAKQGKLLDKRLSILLNSKRFNKYSTLDEAITELNRNVNLPHWQPPEIKTNIIAEGGLNSVPSKDLRAETDRLKSQQTKVVSEDVLDQPKLLSMGDNIESWRNIAKGSTVGKKLLKASFLPVVGSLLAPSIVNAAEQRQEENPNAVNWTQLQLERASQFGTNLSTAGLAGVVTPEPLSTAVGAGAVVVGETIDTAASVPSLLIDAARYAVKHAQNPLTDEELQKEFQKTDDYLGPNFSTL